MRMARVNVYLPDDLADEAKSVGLNVSRLTQEALRSALAANRIDEWLDEIESMRSTGISHDAVAAAVSGAKDDIEDRG
jgi:post-segregation antitoxin (ccd killing protein)